MADCGGGLLVYLWGGGAGRSTLAPLAPLGLGSWPATGLEGAGEDEYSLSTSMGWGVGWSLMADMAEKERRCLSSGGRFSGWESRSSYLDERLDGSELDVERRLELCSLSRTRAWDFFSGDVCGEGRGTWTGALLDFLELKKEGRTIGSGAEL